MVDLVNCLVDEDVGGWFFVLWCASFDIAGVLRAPRTTNCNGALKDTCSEELFKPGFYL